ncbi:MAG: hypothetical protein ACRDPL_08505, partial [Propionibacteriaceae bacterium]
MIRAVTNCSNTASLPHALSIPSWRYTAAIASSNLPIRDEGDLQRRRLLRGGDIERQRVLASGDPLRPDGLQQLHLR